MEYAFAAALVVLIIGLFVVIQWHGADWETVRDSGVYHYQVNRRTGERRVFRVIIGGYQPVDSEWIRTGRWSRCCDHKK
jgi:hypothetical protein